MTLSRKQREIAERHALFLEIAHEILTVEGFHVLSMERIAELAEYSKGTVYQHFSCKEEILVQLCNQCMQTLVSLFERAAKFDGTPRDRISAIFHAHQLWSGIGSNQTEMLQHLSMHGVKDKATEVSLLAHDQLEQRIFSCVLSIIDDAIESGDLENTKKTTASEIVFGFWSLSTGGQLLMTSDIRLSELGVSDPANSLLKMLAHMLDGLNWQPMHVDAQFKKLLNKLNTGLFAEEFDQIRQQSEQDNEHRLGPTRSVPISKTSKGKLVDD